MPVPGIAALEDIFAELIELPPDQRAARLLLRCGDDQSMRDELVELLRHHDGADEFLSTREWKPPAAAGDARQIRIPGYAILGVLGAGGMGLVYLAEQHRPRRRVALKVVRPGPGSNLLVSRFLHEAEVLGRLHHPGIAQIYEAGVGEHAVEMQRESLPLPFIAMEYVDGLPLHEFVRERGLSAAERVELLVRICDAVEHAHQRGVIHRDLKPPNILINKEGLPKVLDFGVARLFGDPIHAQSFGPAVIGTLAYMSPEQVSGQREKVDTRTDVYALGVMLYEMLTGKLPVDPTGLTLDQVSRAIREREPTPPGQLDPSIGRDLEAVILRSLAKDPGRRYASVGDFRADLRAFLEGHPVQARGDSRLYLFTKTLHRHRYWALGGALVFCGVLGFAINAQHQRQREEAAKTEALANFSLASAARKDADAANARLAKALYYSRIGYAQAAAANGDTQGVRRALAECDPALRSWEWSYLDRLTRGALWSTEAVKPSRVYLTNDDPAKSIVVASHMDGVSVLNPSDGSITGRALIGSALGEMATWGGTLGSFSNDLGSQIYELPSFTPLRVLDMPFGAKRGHCFSSDASRLYIAHQTAGVFVFDPRSGKQLDHWEGPADTLSASLTLDDRYLAVGGRGGLYVYDTRDGSIVLKLPTSALIFSVSIRGEGPLVAWGSEDRFARVYDLKLGREIFATQSHSNKVTAVALSNDSTLLATGSTDNSIIIFELPEGREQRRLLGHESTITGLNFSGDGKRLVSAARDGRVSCWSALPEWDDGELPEMLSFCGPVVYFNDRRVVGTTGGVVYAERGFPKIIGDMSGRVLCVRVHDGVLYAISENGTFAAMDSERELFRRQLPASSYSMTVHRGQTWVVSADGKVRVFDALSGAPITEYQVDSKPLLAAASLGDRIVVGGDSGLLHVLNEDGSRVSTIPAHELTLWSITASPNGSSFVSTGEDGQVRLWDSQTLSVRHEYPRSLFAQYGSVFSPDGSRFAVGGFDNTLRVFSSTEPVEVIRLTGHRSLIYRPAFSPDGKELFSASGEGMLRVWNGRPRTPTSDAAAN